MSESDSSLNFSDFLSSDDETTLNDKLFENLMFYLICLEPDLLKVDRKISGKSRDNPGTLVLVTFRVSR